MKCFYHSSDLDGHCSGAIVKRKHPWCEMIGINYGQPFPWESIEPGEDIIMVDFSLQPFSDMKRLNDLCALTWIDHHKTAIDEACETEFLASREQLLEIGRAACELTWEYMYPDIPLPLAVYLLGRYDVWDHSDLRTLPFQYGLRQNEHTSPENTVMWENLFVDERHVEFFLNHGRFILDYETKQNQKFCKAYAFETELNELRAICVNRGFTNSKVFDSVYDPKRHHLMITFCRLKLPARKWTVSLYSTRDDVDCGNIAKSFGGGGHKGAAGFQCSELPFEI